MRAYDQFTDAVRDPTPQEAANFLQAVASHSEDGLLRLLQEHPFVLWGSVKNTLTDQDQVWVIQVAQKSQLQTEDQDFD